MKQDGVKQQHCMCINVSVSVCLQWWVCVLQDPPEEVDGDIQVFFQHDGKVCFLMETEKRHVLSMSVTVNT